MAGPGMNNKMSGTNSVFHCVIDGKLSKAQLLKCSGGGVSRKKAEHALASSHEVPGGLTGKLTQEPITIECSLAMGKSLTDWCNEAFRMNPAYHSGAILQANQMGEVVQELRFYDALIKSVSISALNAGAEEPIKITVEIQPTYSEHVTHDTPQAGFGQIDQGQLRGRAMDASSFVCELQGMGNEAGQVVKVDQIKWECTLAKDPVSDPTAKFPDWRMAGFKQPDLKISYNAALNTYFREFYDSFVRDGVNQEAAHRWGTITFHDLAGAPQGEIRFDRLGMTGSPTFSLDATGSEIALNSVTCYFSLMQFNSMTGFDE